MNQMDLIKIEKVKEDVQNVKNTYDSAMKLVTLMFNERHPFQKFRNSEETDSEIMLDLMTDILYHNKYLDVLKNALYGSNEIEDYFNISFVNRHLKTILHEYEIITNNLDNIIFENNDLCK